MLNYIRLVFIEVSLSLFLSILFNVIFIEAHRKHNHLHSFYVCTSMYIIDTNTHTQTPHVM